MANTKLLNELRRQLEQLKSEYVALSEAYRLLSQAKSGRGRKHSLDFLVDLDSAAAVSSVRRTGRRGRPPGSKNKPGYKKPGPKPGPTPEVKKKAAAKKSSAKRASKKG